MEAKMRENGLQKAFKETSGPGIKREKVRKQNRKKAFLDEMITLKLLDINDEEIKGCTFKIMRRRLNKAIIQENLNTCPQPCTIDYCYDESGEVIWVENLLMDAKPHPSYYVIVPLNLREPFDICDDPKYEGQTMFVMQYVPFFARDQSTIVDPDTIRTWLMYAILEEDPYVPPLEVNIERQKNKIKDIDRRLKQVVKQEFLEADGKPMVAEKAELEREAMFTAIGEERERQEQELKRREKLLDTHKAWRKSMCIGLEQGDTDENSQTCTWFAKFSGSDDARDMEQLLLRKNDYTGIRLACPSKEKNLPAWAGRGMLPDGSKSFLPDYTMLQVNIAGVRIMRIPHGVGVYKSLDRKSVDIAAEKFYYFYGNWYSGKRVGYGIEVNDSGIYSGRFVDNWRDGHGRWDIGNGTTVKATFGKTLTVPENCSSLNPNDINPYLDGEPNADGLPRFEGTPPNIVEISFADGGYYRGAMIDGKITGKGEYESAFGEVYNGTFKDGVLHCSNGYYMNHSKEEFVGEFDHGELHGAIKYRHPKGHSFQGYYDRSLRHGRGVEVYNKRGIYRGYFVNGYRHGKGEMDYIRRDMDEYWRKKKAKEAAAEARASHTVGPGSGPQDDKPKEARPGDVSQKPSTAQRKREAAAEEKNKAAGAKGGEAGKKKEEDEEEPLEEEISEFQMRFQGHLMAGNIIRGSGTVTDADEMVPRILSVSNKRRMEPILSFLRKAEKINKGNARAAEKFTDMELFVRREITRKKTRIFHQQKHFTKKIIYQNEVYGKIEEILLKSRADIRFNRLERVKRMKESLASNAFIPRMQGKPNSNLNSHLHGVFTHVQPEAESQDKGTVKRTLPVLRAIVSDFEEIGERGRFLKYDSMLERAEKAFADKKKEQVV